MAARPLIRRSFAAAVKLSQEDRYRHIFIKDFTFVSELSGTNFSCKYAADSQIWCLDVCAGEDWGPSCAETLLPAVPLSNKQTIRIAQSSNLKKKKQSIEKFADFQEFRGFSIYERKSDLGVNYDKLCDTIVTILASGVKDQKTSKLSQHKLKQAVL